MKRALTYLAAWCCILSAGAWDWMDKGVTLSGSIQSEMLVPRRDDATGAEKKGSFLTNTYAELMLQSKYVDAGARLEFLEYPLPGFEKDFEGWGVPHFWVKGRVGKFELTGGTFYEQFGSGFILRTYEERSLGIDNSLLGGRVVVKPLKGVTLKALSGVQRRYWKWNSSVVSGADAELHVDEWFPGMQKADVRLMTGVSWVNKYEKKEDIYADPTHRYNLPKFVNAWDYRIGLDKGPWNFLVEYAQKSQDPSFDNGYSYDKGYASMISGSYSEKGLSLLLQVKRSENMSFRSKRTQLGTSSFINHLPAFTQDQTYALAAIYPYATQLADGEFAWQAEAGYNFKRKTALGGKYGMNVKVNFSHVRWQGTVNYQDIDVQISRKLSKNFKLNLMYLNQRYNQLVVEGHGDMVCSNIFIADGKYQFSPKTTLRAELQYLTTKQDQGDWAYGLLELSLVPHWMITVSDMWNCGETGLHYYQGLVTYNIKQHRIQGGYGRTRAGYNCAGGVCRYVPASTGFTLSYNYNF
ncbi:MAG: hypothetical protein IJ615_01490 [Bacteroidaceae bacterium]|nr:hypothetical protein [Bacteroidaceae bacterium]